MTAIFDILVIGSGIAGASVAARLSQSGRRIVLIEGETHPGYHSTGRSAAVWEPAYGPLAIRQLTRASAAFFTAPPTGFTDAALMTPLAILTVAPEERQHRIAEELAAMPDAKQVEISPAEAEARMPVLKKGWTKAALLTEAAGALDVDAIHQGFLKLFKATGGSLVTNATVTALEHQKGLWHATTRQGTFTAPIVVNAAGAWADQLGQMAQAEPIGLKPLRRTALTVAAPSGLDTAGLPMTLDVDEEFYIKPDAGRLLLSPANEDLETPGDTQPDDYDIALCVWRIEEATDLKISKIERKWAGLRSFVADKAPVAGWSARAENFFWLAGQGGYGIQTAPALSAFAAAQILGQDLPEVLQSEGFNPADLAPNRAALAV